VLDALDPDTITWLAGPLGSIWIDLGELHDGPEASHVPEFKTPPKQ